MFAGLAVVVSMCNEIETREFEMENWRFQSEEDRCRGFEDVKAGWITEKQVRHPGFTNRS